MDEKAQELIAKQLSCPSGEQGLEVADIMEKSNRKLTEDTIDQLHLSKGLSVGEIGIGNGVLSEQVLKAIGKDGSYHGFDLSSDMISLAQKNLRAAGYENTSFYLGDFTTHQESMLLDRIFGVNLLYFIRDLELFFKRVFDTLNPEGLICFGIRTAETMSKIPLTKFGFEIRNDDVYLAAIKKAGFKNLECLESIEVNKPDSQRQIKLDFDFHNRVLKAQKI